MDEKKEKNDAKEGGAASTQKTSYEDVLMKEAYENMNKGNFEAAISIYTDIIRRFSITLEDSQRSLLHSEMGTALFWLGEYDAARNHSEKALAYGDRNDQAYTILGKIAVAEYKFPEARGYFSEISRENPARDLGFCLVAVKLRDADGADQYLREAAGKGKLSSSDPELCLFAAYIQLLKGNADYAVSEARSLISKCERDPSLHILIAEIFMTAGNYGEAIAICKQVLVKCPQNDQAFGVMAYAAYNDDDFGLAESHAAAAVERNPRNAYAKTVLMKVVTRAGDYARAEELGLEILDQSPEYSLGHANLGDVYFNQGRYELAQSEYEQTEGSMNSATKGARLRQARMKFMAGKCAEAADILEHLIVSYHTYYDDAMCDLALCYDEMQDEVKKDELIDKMQMRRSMYHRTEKLLQSFTA